MGSPIPVLEGVRRRQFAVAENGTLAYVAGYTEEAKRSLIRVDRRGGEELLVTREQGYIHPPRLSPDGRRLAVTINNVGDPPEIWLYELARDTFTRFTFSGGHVSVVPIWSPDGRRLFFNSDRIDATFQPFSKPTDGSGISEPLVGSVEAFGPNSISSDGKKLFVSVNNIGSGRDIAAVHLDDGELETVVGTPFDEHNGMISPNDRWLAYVSNESGRDEVYVRALTGAATKTTISTAGGTEPLWSRDGQELFYREGDKFMAVRVTAEPVFEADNPRFFSRAVTCAKTPLRLARCTMSFPMVSPSS